MKAHILALTLFLSACGTEKPAETAESRANVFVYSIINQNPQAFWDSLDAPSQDAIASLAGATIDAPDISQKAFALSGRWRSLFSLKPIKAKIPADATEATVTVESLAGEKMDLSLTKQGDRWLVHLPIEQLTATPTSAPSAAPASAPASAPTSASAPTE